MAEPQARQGQILSTPANAAKRNSPSWVRMPLLVAGIATFTTLMIVSCAKGIKQNEGVDTMVNGNQAQMVVEVPKQQVPPDTLNTTPRLVIPDVRTLEHYSPFSKAISDDSLFVKGAYDKLPFKLAWMRTEDTERPFGLPQKVIDSYSPKETQELNRRWEIAKNEIRVAFQSAKGATPSNALQVHTPEEVTEMLRTWEIDKEAQKRNDALMARPSIIK